jgi:hypothetical protein
MRILGFILLICGFVSLLLTEMRRYQMPLDLAAAQSKSLPAKESYSKQELDDAIRRAALSGSGLARGVATSGLIMLAGGIVLDRARRRRTRASGPAEPCAAPNGGPATQVGNSGVKGGAAIGELNR